MAKALNLVLGGSKYALTPTKVERKKIYGWTELRATAPDNTVCRQAGLDSDGRTIVPKGATKMGMMTTNGQWMDKSELEARQTLPGSIRYHRPRRATLPCRALQGYTCQNGEPIHGQERMSS